MRLILPLVLCLAALSCAAPEPASLCDRFFTPYPDLVSQRPRTTRNAGLMDAMEHYAKQDYAAAAKRLQQVVDRDPRDITARLYLVNALLATGDAYRAEMHLDFMENYRDRSFSDQVDWYNAICWLCEGQLERAAEQAAWIAGRPHSYREEAEALARALKNP